MFGAASMLACSGPPIVWGGVTYPARPPAVATAPASAVIPADACPGSFRTSVLGRAVYGVWWRVRPDSSALLMAARSADGGRTWTPPVAADTSDHSVRGCARPAPALIADPNGYVYFTYFMESAGGAGIFFTHSMDARSIGVGDGIFHSPVAVMYGGHPSRVAISARGDRVVVAFEDPNSERPQVDVALSHTMGHIFDSRVTASLPDLSAADPRVLLSGDTVTVWWMERPATAAITGTTATIPDATGRIALRRGIWH